MDSSSQATELRIRRLEQELMLSQATVANLREELESLKAAAEDPATPVGVLGANGTTIPTASPPSPTSSSSAAAPPASGGGASTPPSSSSSSSVSNPSVAKCVTQRLLHTISRLFTVLELTGTKLEEEVYEQVMAVIKETGFEGFDNTGAIKANEKPAPPGLLSTIIQAWQALTVYSEPPMEWTAVHKRTGDVIKASTLRKQCDPVRTSGRLQRVDRARALAEKASVMLKQWSGYLRAEKREKTKELYFWTDYVIEHEGRRLEVDSSVLEASVKGDDIGNNTQYLIGSAVGQPELAADQLGPEDEDAASLSFLEEALASLLSGSQGEMGRSGTLPSKPILPTAGAAPVRQQQQQQQRSGGGGCKCGGTCCGGSGRQQQQWQEGPHELGGSTGGGHRRSQSGRGRGPQQQGGQHQQQQQGGRGMMQSAAAPVGSSTSYGLRRPDRVSSDPDLAGSPAVMYLTGGARAVQSPQQQQQLSSALGGSTSATLYYNSLAGLSFGSPATSPAPSPPIFVDPGLAHQYQQQRRGIIGPPPGLTSSNSSSSTGGGGYPPPPGLSSSNSGGGGGGQQQGGGGGGSYSGGPSYLHPPSSSRPLDPYNPHAFSSSSFFAGAFI